MEQVPSPADFPPKRFECRHLIKAFGGVRPVNDITADFHAGQVTALIGPNGAGKTTLFHLLAGSLRPDSGSIEYSGRRIDGLPEWKIARYGVGRLFQDVRVFGKLSVIENVLLGFPQQAGEAPLMNLLSPRRVAQQEARLTEAARRHLATVGLNVSEQAEARALSYGQQKLLALARLLAQEASVLLLDEPTAGVNPTLIRTLIEVISRLASSGKTIVVIEHNMSVVQEIARHVYYMESGSIVASGNPDEVLCDQNLRAAYIGL